jgi:hypothetical protein
MDSHPTTDLKHSLDMLAQSFYSDEGGAVLRSWLQTIVGGNESRESISVPQIRADAEMIGIWEKRGDGGAACWVRPAGIDPWRFWSNAERIGAKGKRKRVVLLGESVARGFYYEPKFNPASALRIMLESACGHEQIDVVDLARLDLEMPDLRRLAAAAVALGPDAMVIFAGNNWQPFRVESRLIEESVGLMRKAHLSELKAEVSRELCLQVRSLLKELGNLSRTHGIPVLLILPEFNLRDWENARNGHPVFLRVADLADWFAARSRAEEALDRGDYEAAARFAGEMIQLDGGANPRGPEIMASVQKAAGDVHGERTALERAMDAGLFEFTASPRCFQAIRDTMRMEASEQGLYLVDLPRRFQEHFHDAIPGRYLFHDYCHLTAEGISIAMAFAAECLLPLLGKPARDWTTLRSAHPPLDPKLLAQANFLAGVHNASWGQGYEIVFHHFCQALRFSKDIAFPMFLFLDCCTRRTPTLFCESFAALASVHTANFLRFLFDNPRSGKGLALTAIDALVEALAASGVDVREMTTNRLISEYGGAVNLLESNCLFDAMDLDRTWRERDAYFRARQRKTVFGFVSDGERPVQVHITYRSGSKAPGSVVHLLVNGAAVAALEGAAAWRDASIDFPKTLLRPGLNRVEILWPVPEANSRDSLAERVEALRASELADVYPIFGEIHHLFASPVAAYSTEARQLRRIDAVSAA